MSLSVSSFSANPQVYDPPTQRAATQPKPSVGQEVDALASSGHSAAQIASTLGIPVSQVDSTLGVTSSSSTSAATAVLKAAARLSVLA